VANELFRADCATTNRDGFFLFYSPAKLTGITAFIARKVLSSLY
jgi:hypothetical protein